MNDTMLNIIEGLVESRQNFLNDRTIRAIPFHQRGQNIYQFVLNEHYILETASRIYNNNLAIRNAAATLITFNMPNANETTFMDPVIVSATREQITSSLEDCPNATHQCSICQEANNATSARMRQCGHIHHRRCIEEWLAMSVRCPVCRHDIREAGPTNQTFFAASQTSSPPASQ